MPGGADGQVGWVTEATPGTFVVPTKFLPIRSENIKQNIEYLDTQTISARRTLRLTKAGTKTVEGSITTELPNTTIATLLKHMFGAVTTTGVGPYTHTYTPGDLTGDSLSIQVGRPDINGAVQPFSYAGCKVSTWTVSANVGELATLEVGIIGMTETTATALATASYDAAWEPFVFTEASLTIAAGAANNVRSISITGENTVEARHRIGSATSKQPLETGVRPYTGTIEVDFEGLTDYNRFVNGTESALVATFNNGTQTLKFTMNAQFVGETPELSGFELLGHNMPFRCLSSTSDAAAITVELVNGEASAG